MYQLLPYLVGGNITGIQIIYLIFALEKEIIRTLINVE